MIFNLRKRERKIDLQEMAIRATQNELEKKIDEHHKDLKKVNKRLADGFVFNLGKATHR